MYMWKEKERARPSIFLKEIYTTVGVYSLDMMT